MYVYIYICVCAQVCIIKFFWSISESGVFWVQGLSNLSGFEISAHFLLFSDLNLDFLTRVSWPFSFICCIEEG